MKSLIFIGCSLGVFVFLILRAIYVPLAHDEIATFYYYVQTLQINPLSGAHPDANNHILNSLLSGISHKLFGYSVLAVRLPNLISFLIYAFFVFKIGDFFKNKIVTWGFYLGMLFPIYFIQFFALNRGYGMSMAFLMGAIYFVQFTFDKKSIWPIVAGSVSLLLALFANLSLLPLVLLMFGIHLFLVLKNKKYYSSGVSLTLIGTTIAVSLFFIYKAIIISFKMKNEGSLYYGELDGYWAVTVKSQLMMLFETTSQWVQLILALVLLFTLLLYVLKWIKNSFSFFFSSENLFFILLFGAVIASLLMALILGVNYPEDRVGMYVYPLLVGALCFGVDQYKSRFSLVLLIFVFIIPFHFLMTVNIEKTSIWKQDQLPESFYERIKNTKTVHGYPASVGGDELRLFVYSEKIYRDTSKPNQLQFWSKTIYDSNMNLIPDVHPGKYYDYLITNTRFIKDITHLYDSIDFSKHNGHGLFKRKYPAVKQLLDSQENHLEGETSQEYFEILHQTYDSLGVDALMIGLNLEIQSLNHPFKSRVVAEARDKETGEVIQYQYFQLDWLSNKVVSKKPWVNSLYLQNLPKFKEVEIVVYLWNIDKKPYSIYKGKSEVFRVFNIDIKPQLENDFFEKEITSLN